MGFSRMSLRGLGVPCSQFRWRWGEGGGGRTHKYTEAWIETNSFKERTNGALPYQTHWMIQKYRDTGFFLKARVLFCFVLFCLIRYVYLSCYCLTLTLLGSPDQRTWKDIFRSRPTRDN